jgi:hypothetical protein
MLSTGDVQGDNGEYSGRLTRGKEIEGHTTLIEDSAMSPMTLKLQTESMLEKTADRAPQT